MSVSYGVSLDATPTQQFADIAKNQYDYYTQSYIPFENNLISAANGAQDTSRMNSMLASLGNTQNSVLGTQNRMQQRYGMALDPRQVNGAKRLNNINNAAQTANARNTLGQSLYDQNMGEMGALSTLGRGLSTQAVGGIGAAAGNEHARLQQQAVADQQRSQAAAAQQASTISTLINVGTAIAMSDAALKTDIEPIHDALNKVEALNGVTWEWNERASTVASLDGASAGVIAQDLEQVLPAAVLTHPDGYKVVNYAAVTGLLVNAVKELAAEVKTLQEAK